ncbi:DNA cytosine methyltransferase [Paenibacillus thermotolerans]|uniref:DNA cytosine methyltransferase n=1 Tax=Paenibacillus thermotolerans TaxID=3027807 RepID=UPI0023679C10|nr:MULTISPECIES: DNA cytosine methyltransferase [unclassified Paenibacillus]
MRTERTAAILFGGIGGFSRGLQESKVEAYGKVHSFEILCSIDYDPVTCHNHDLITGEKTAVNMDLFDRQQYIDWHGYEPPTEWREMTPYDVWKAFGEQVPDYIFLSPPCKGFSGLLPGEKSKSKKYQALNLLTIRGLDLCLKACLMYGDELPMFIHFENVPRITTRGKHILEKIKKLLKGYGFAYDQRSDHNLGEIGGLGQNRMRFLILARNEKRVPNFCYLPPKKPLKTIGDIIGPLPMPGDTERGGPLHRLPNLQWKTWVRLALIPAKGDWRDLNKIDWEQYRILHEPRGGAYAVEEWNETSRTVTGTAGPGRSNGAAAISDPRSGFKDGTHTSIYQVCKFEEPGTTVTGAHRPNNGAISISDPRLNKQDGKHPGVYRIVRADEPAPTVTGTRFGSGAIAIADPRCKTELHPDSYGVQEWDETAKTVRSANRIMQSAASIADPRISDRPGRYTDKYRMQSIDKPAATVTGVTDVQSGAQLVADPRMNCSPRSGTMGVQQWDEPGKTVIGSGDIHASAAAVADPRIPDDKESGVWVIIAEDGTWHRPLTTFELAMLQGFPTHLPDGRPFQLEGCSDAKAREYIGNAVPVQSATAMGNVILIAMANAEAGISFEFSFQDVWVLPQWERPEITILH